MGQITPSAAITLAVAIEEVAIDVGDTGAVAGVHCWQDWVKGAGPKISRFLVGEPGLLAHAPVERPTAKNAAHRVTHRPLGALPATGRLGGTEKSSTEPVPRLAAPAWTGTVDRDDKDMTVLANTPTFRKGYLGRVMSTSCGM